MRTLRLALWIAVAVALFGLGALTVGGFSNDGPAPLAEGGTAAPGAPLGGAFALIDHEGQPVTEAIFRGKPSATLFGFTHCPDVCPTGLMQMSTWADALGTDAEQMSFIFVSVDPERDTPEVMDTYISAFSDRIVGITGSPDEVRAMLQDYKIFSRKVSLEGGDYTMDHMASIILQDADGDFVGTITSDEDRDTAIAKIRRLVAG